MTDTKMDDSLRRVVEENERKEARREREFCLWVAFGAYNVTLVALMAWMLWGGR